MANAYDFLGDNRAYFMKSSWQVYTDLSGARQYVGKTENEKTFSLGQEIIDWFDNTGGTQTKFVLDIDKMSPVVNFSFMQVADPNILATAWNGDLDLSDPNFVYDFLGSEPNTLQEAEWRFVGRTRTGLGMTFVIRNGVMVPNGDWTSGGGGAYTSIPVSVHALQDTSISNGARDLAYFIIDRFAAS
ncbi:MAG TPA: hypothetical protein ENH82_17955 [bacterium]|nr:hypothetical protein [bacterium]